LGKLRADLVIFDVDGTLLATDAFWLEIGRQSVAGVFERHAIAHELPPARRFLDAIGLPMAEFWQFVLPEDAHALVDEVEAEAQKLEERAFARGMGAMYPGARQLLDDLHHAGRFLGLASNCGQRYLDGFVSAFELDGVVDVARCVDSPGIASKAEMISDIMLSTGAESAIMVGDRDNDREAARANGIPFALFTGGFQSTEPAAGDRVVASYGELRDLLLP
jgi:phosphoglycolate phosphatase-like HAD superfamily hydrolase